MITACSGDCCVCANMNTCCAEAGDDHFCPASEEQLRQRLVTMKNSRALILAELKKISEVKGFEFQYYDKR